MDGNHPKNKGTHPRRAKAKDNPYTIYTTGSDNGHPKYILEFTDGQKRPQRLEIEQALYELFDQFELEDKRFLNEVDRHYEHIDLTEAEIEHRAAYPKESLEEEIGRVLLYEELHIVAPITSRIHTKSKIPTHSYIGIIGRMKYPSVVMLEQLRTLDKRRIGYYIGKLPEEKMQDVTRALCVSLAIRQNTAKGM